MKLVSINIAKPETVSISGQNVLTGINKKPQSEPIWLGKLNLVGDGQADLTVHGGEFQAVYSYPVEHYAYWAKELDQPALPYGTFGENFTVSGLLEKDVFVGDIFKVGNAIIQATMPRIPCFKFGNKVGKPDILEKFLFSGFSGFYHKVIEEGEVAVGNQIELVERDTNSISIRKALGLYKLKEGDVESLSHALTIQSLPPLLRENYESRLEKL
ncbi:MAG: MOSC domain-containing protein [Methylotenera sp.]|jgi:MOSC domain-containing protein YiiM